MWDNIVEVIMYESEVSLLHIPEDANITLSKIRNLEKECKFNPAPNRFFKTELLKYFNSEQVDRLIHHSVILGLGDSPIPHLPPRQWLMRALICTLEGIIFDEILYGLFQIRKNVPEKYFLQEQDLIARVIRDIQNE